MTLQFDCNEDRVEGEISSILEPLLAVLPSFDHLIRPLQHAHWNRQADLLRCFQVDDKLELPRLLHRQISRVSAFQYLVHVLGRSCGTGHRSLPPRRP